MNKILFPFRFLAIILVTILSGTLCFVLLPLGRERTIYISSQIWSWVILTASGARVRVTGLDNLGSEKPVLFVCNHQSSLDIPVIFKTLPTGVFFLAKKELKKVPFLGWGMRAVGMIFVDRGTRDGAIKSLKAAGKTMIDEGKNVVSFPEGTRSADGRIRMFKRGTFILAKESSIPFVPMAIKGANNVSPVGRYMLFPGEIKFAIGKAISPLDYPDAGPEELADIARKEVQKLHDSL